MSPLAARAAFNAATDAAIKTPGHEVRVAGVPHVGVTLLATDRATRELTGASVAIQDPAAPVELLRAQARALARLAESVGAVNCARALRTHLAPGATLNLVLDDECLVLRIRDTTKGAS